MIPLSRLLDGSPDGERPVAFGREGEPTCADLRRDVAALAARLESTRGRALLLH
ncbi:MAG: hypothetical protein HKP30_10710, partial [Myxococcales bacterium]|nr:hypothetical protein [Myxococcales bacterium]